ncbi:hypothetical protein [Desulfatibacillum aliphaticivorans]|uniref:hypothetical protein n=1 Tax=Desulfatibacillum aliphaticivorans TaxID=218208 RepID=UPI00040F5393|nr:hypothetical protein [Desulfatibacillum aliphaticivorans]
MDIFFNPLAGILEILLPDQTKTAPAQGFCAWLRDKFIKSSAPPAWADEFEGPDIDSKWTLLPMSASGTAAISDGKLDFFVDGPTDGANAYMGLYQAETEVSYPLTIEAAVECPGYNDQVSGSGFALYAFHGGAIAEGLQSGALSNSAGILWLAGGWIQARSFDGDGNSNKYDPVSYTYGGSILLRISIDAAGSVSLSYKGAQDADFASLNLAPNTPSFSGASTIDIFLQAESKVNDAAHHWLVDRIGN